MSEARLVICSGDGQFGSGETSLFLRRFIERVPIAGDITAADYHRTAASGREIGTGIISQLSVTNFIL